MMGKSTQNLLWVRSVGCSIIILVFSCLYYFLIYRLINIRIFNKSLASSAAVLVGMSLGLSGLSYYFKSFKKRLIYRKYLGLIGFYLAVLHTIISVFLLSGLFPFPVYYLESANLLPFILALSSLVILTLMAAISNQIGIRLLGGRWWRRTLRIGYLALLLIILHFGLKNYQSWYQRTFWITRSLPPLNLLVFVFVLIIFGLRIALWISVTIGDRRGVDYE